MAALATRRSASERAQRALSRAAGDRRIIAGAAATAGAALVAGVTRELVDRAGNGKPEDRPSRAYRIKREEAPTEAVRRIVCGRADDALEHLQEGVDGEPAAAVHEVRKDLKKARSVLRLVRKSIGEDAYGFCNSRLRDAGRTLSGYRDAEAKVETLDALEGRFDEQDLPGAFGALRKVLEEDQESTDDAELHRAAAVASQAIASVREPVGRWDFDHGGWKLVEAGLERSYRRGRNRFADVCADPTPANVHEWRKRVKDLWYHLRLLRDCWPEVLGETSDQVHELADLLGDHHDLTVLATDARARPALADHVQELSASLNVIEARQVELLGAAVGIGERIYAELPKAFVKRLRAYWKAARAD
jgi:CHAD domain-containing protein